jgi:Ca2+-transporting ATPase
MRPQMTEPASWHAQPPAAVLEAFDSSPDGLSPEEAARRLAEGGGNRLAPPAPESAAAILAAQFRGVVTFLLLAAVALSLVMGERLEAAAIAVVLVINAALGFTVELRARRAMEALLQLGASHATVVRGGRPLQIDADALVPGDVVEVTAGQTVPADARLLDGTDLRIDEAALTGESLPIGKQPDASLPPETPLADRTTMLYRGTTVAAGLGRAVVTATGNDTEVGRIGALTRSLSHEPTPLERRLDDLGRRLAWVALGIAALVAVLGILEGAPWGLMIETAIALAVAAVPEGLPAVATIALAVGLRRMARRNALVRRLSAVEALGSTTVICTDKTRTLTTGEMTLVTVWAGGEEFDLASPSGSGDRGRVRRALAVAALASRRVADRGEGAGAALDPVDEAVLRGAAAEGLATSELLAAPAARRIPFSSDRKFAGAIYERETGLEAAVKGAPRAILAMCDWLRTGDGIIPLTDAERARVAAINDGLASRGLRVLGTAGGPVEAANEGALRGLVFEGYVGLMDPPAPGVAETIARLKRAGLRVVMLTGDQRRTAEAIGRQLGLLGEGDEAIDSAAVRAAGEAAIAARLGRLAAFSRITAEDKLTIVGALQRRHEIVAMLGDGVNDAPALRKADVGVAMGVRGTDVAKEAAAIVLEDDRFETVAAAVEEGRVIADNIRKFIFFLFSCNLAEVLVLLLAEVLGLPQPLQPLQILWLNLVTDTFPALALAVEPGDADVMARPPRRPDESILSRAFLTDVAIHGMLILAATMMAYAWGLSHDRSGARTMAFMTLALAQIAHLGNARSDRPVLGWQTALANPWALAAVAASGLLQLLPLAVPGLDRILGVAHLSAAEWLVVLACTTVTPLGGQALRVWRASRTERNQAARAHAETGDETHGPGVRRGPGAT